jgi:diaminopimelate decarboxylase
MWLSKERAQELSGRYGTPLYIYNGDMLQERAQLLQDLQTPYGLTVRYALKANPHPTIISLFYEAGLSFDASSSFEAQILLDKGIEGSRISLASQQPGHNLQALLKAGVQYVATSLHQLDLFMAIAPTGAHVALRINPGIGSGHSNRVATGGIAASFGIWHEYLDEALVKAKEKQITIDRILIHIGCGTDTTATAQAMDIALDIIERMPDVTTLDMGGGYKVKRTTHEKETDMSEVIAVYSSKLTAFANKTGRKLHLEIEPGTWLVAHAGCLLSEVVDICDTGNEGYTFLKTNTGMNDILRPTMYGAQHEIEVLSNTDEYKDYIVVGHNCETGDTLTIAPGDPEIVAPRKLRKARISDLLVIGDTGAYCASMRAVGYNAYPSAQEIVVSVQNDAAAVQDHVAVDLVLASVQSQINP